MYSELIQEFDGQRVVDFDNENSWEGTGVAYRFREEYEDEVSIADRLDTLLANPESHQVTHLIIGAWSGSMEGGDSTEIVKKLVEIAPRLPAMRHLFLGEMTSEECELSWIYQSDVAPILKAYPNLQSFRIRGGTHLSISPVHHDHLQELAIETGGLQRSVLRELFACEFPNLERLELLLGEENYGFDGGVEDLQPLLSGRLYPKLTSLGLMNSVIANDIAAVIVNSPIVERLTVLDLSQGNLDDEGVRSLHGLSAFPKLKQLNLSYHYATEEELNVLKKALSCEVIAADPQQPDDEWRPILHAE